MIQRKLLIQGKVQGVGYRASTCQKAAQFPEITGYVRNLPDGRVEAVFCGNEEDVNSLIQWCRSGPPSARVTSVDIIEEEINPNYSNFNVR